MPTGSRMGLLDTGQGAAARQMDLEYADVRGSTNRSQNVSTREQIVTGLSDSETSGVGIRVLVDGTWGFAASNVITSDSAEEVAIQAEGNVLTVAAQEMSGTLVLKGRCRASYDVTFQKK